MEADVVMVMYNPPDRAVESVLSLVKHHRGVARLIIIDNCSTNKTNILRVTGYADVIISLKSQASLGAAWNIGLSYTNTNVVVITNDDIIFTDNWLPPLIQNLEDKKIGVLQPFNTVGEIPANFPFNYMKHRNISDIPDDNFFGCCFAIRKDIIKGLKNFDKKWPDSEDYTYFYEGYYPIGAEDYDFNLRVEGAGYKTQTDFSSYVHHFSAETCKHIDDFESIKDEARDIFKKRWGKKIVFKDFKK